MPPIRWERGKVTRNQALGGGTMRKLTIVTMTIVALGMATACNNNDGPEPLNTGTPTPATPEDQAEAEARDVLETFQQTREEIEAGEKPLEALDEVAFGSGSVNTKASIEKAIRENRDLEGDRKVVSLDLKSIELAGDYPNVVLTECVDFTETTLLVDGVESTEPRPDFLQTDWTIAKDQGLWKVNGSNSEEVAGC